MPLPGELPKISTSKFEPEASVRLGTEIVSGLVPGARCPPLSTVTAPLCPRAAQGRAAVDRHRPGPVPEPLALFTSSVPPATVVPPLYVLSPVSVAVPLPLLVRLFRGV